MPGFSPGSLSVAECCVCAHCRYFHSIHTPLLTSVSVNVNVWFVWAVCVCVCVCVCACVCACVWACMLFICERPTALSTLEIKKKKKGVEGERERETRRTS